MNLWLDDTRPAPEGWAWAGNVEAAKALLVTGIVEVASLDHDLGEHSQTGYHLVCWMEETGYWPLRSCRVHSMNPSGRQMMQAAIDKHYN